MDYYQQFTLLADPEFSETTLMNALMAKLHRALHDLGQGEVGVSFPSADKNMGAVLRLHGSREALARLEDTLWYRGMRDHCEISTIETVPDAVQWRLVRRRQPKLTAAKVRRGIKRGNYTKEQAQTLWSESKDRLLKGPFVQLKSISSGEPFRLYIEQLPQPGPCLGSFNRYGLATEATIPWF